MRVDCTRIKCSDPASGHGSAPALMIDSPADAPSFESKEVRSRLRWPCRFQYKQDMETIGREVMASRLPDLFAKGLSEAFELYGG